jgi:hypothetical protein
MMITKSRANGAHAINARYDGSITNSVAGINRDANASNGMMGSTAFRHPEPEICKIVPNAIYLTFNAPQVDEYVSVVQST